MIFDPFSNGRYIDMVFGDPVPEAALFDPQYFGGANLYAVTAFQGFDNQGLFHRSQANVQVVVVAGLPGVWSMSVDG